MSGSTRITNEGLSAVAAGSATNSRTLGRAVLLGGSLGNLPWVAAAGVRMFQGHRRVWLPALAVQENKQKLTDGSDHLG